MSARPPLAVALLLTVAGPLSAQAPADPPPVRTNGVAIEGYLTTIDEVNLAAERPGILHVLNVEEGSRVEADEVVAELADDLIRAKLATARRQAEDTISEEYAVRAAAVSRADWERMVRANRQVDRVIPASEVERAKLSYEQARAQIRKSRFDRELAGLQVDELEAELGTYVVSAPFAGVVQKVLARPGEAVQQSEPIVRLINTDRLRVEAFVPVSEVLRLRVGDEAEGVVVLPGADGAPPESLRFAGRVSFIDPSEAQQTGDPKVRVYVEVDNSDGRFRGGLRANVTAFPGTAPKPPAKPKPTDDAADETVPVLDAR